MRTRPHQSSTKLDEVYDHATWLMRTAPAWHVHKFLTDAYRQYGYSPVDVAAIRPLPKWQDVAS